MEAESYGRRALGHALRAERHVEAGNVRAAALHFGRAARYARQARGGGGGLLAAVQRAETVTRKVARAIKETVEREATPERLRTLAALGVAAAILSASRGQPRSDATSSHETGAKERGGLERKGKPASEWTHSQDFEAEDPTLVPGGMVNYGASCYINATLQCLIAVPEFEPRAVVKPAYDEIRRVMNSGAQPTKKQIQALLDAANVQDGGQPRGTTLRVTEQADANELMLAIGASDRSPFAFWFRQTLSYRDATGQTRESVTSDPATGVSLKLDNSGITSTSVVSLMGEFFGTDEPEDFISQKTPAETKTNQIKTIRLSQPPRVLVVHLARFSDVESKNDLEVTFNETLSVQAYAADGASGTYDLFAVVIHSGSLNGGHYWALVKKNGAWKKYDDERVTEASFETVLEEGKGGERRPTAYVLLYRKEDVIKSR